MTNNGDTWYIRNNESAPNYKIMTSKFSEPLKWDTFISHNDSIYIDGFDVFEKYVVVYEQHSGVIKPHIFFLKMEQIII